MTTLLSILLYLAGAVTSIGIHEGSHMIVAEIQGVELEWDGGSWTTPHKPSSSLKLAGVVAQAVTSEVILLRGLHDISPYFQGVLHANIIHVGTYGALRGSTGDFTGLSSSWGRATALHSTSVAARSQGKGLEVKDSGVVYTWRW